MKRYCLYGLLALSLGCNQGPATPVATTPTATRPTATPTHDFSTIQGVEISDISATPFQGTSVEFTNLVGTKLTSKPGAYIAMLDQNHPEQVLLAFVPGVDPGQLDKRSGAVLKLKGKLQPIEDAGLVEVIEGKLAGKLHRHQDKPMWLELSSDPWGATSTPATPIPTSTPQAKETP